MATLILELNDSGIGVALDDKVQEVEPGYALRDRQALTIGVDAQAQARSNPQYVSNRYWDTLDQDTLGQDSSWRQTPADLSYAQLTGIWERYSQDAERVFLAVPSSFTRAQLGLILGMARKGDIPVVSMIDSAVAALAKPPACAELIYLDMTLHRVVATRCALDERLRVVAHAEDDQLGLTTFQAKWAAAIADVCVRTTRFDPMHSAAAEQKLYANLDGLLEALARGDEQVSIEVEAGDEPRSVAVDRAALVQAATPLYRRIVSLVDELVADKKASHIVLSERFAGFVDLAATLHDASDAQVSTMTAHSCLKGIAGSLAEFTQDGAAVGLIRERSIVAASAPSSSALVANKVVTPSHVLVAGEAYALAEKPFVVGTATKDGSWGYRVTGAVKGVSRSHCAIALADDRVVVMDHSTFGTYVNGQRIVGEQRLSAGDIVRLGNPGVELRLVRERCANG